MAEAGPDLFHLHSWTSGAGIEHLRQVARLGIPNIVTMHVPSALCMRGTMLLYKRDATDSLVSRLSSRAATILSVRASASTKARQLRSMATLSERIVAPSEWVRAALEANAIPPEKVVVSAQAASGARLEAYKGADTLIKALADVPKSLPVCLRIAGTGSESAYVRAIEAAAAKDQRIELAGLVEHEQVQNFPADIDVLAVSSRYMETSPIVVQEAQAMGIPVMGANLGGIAERVRNGIDGWLLPFDDPGSWSAALREAVTDREKVRRLSINMQRTRTIEDVASDMSRLYNVIMEKKRSAQAHDE